MTSVCFNYCQPRDFPRSSHGPIDSSSTYRSRPLHRVHLLASIAVNVNATCYWPNAILFTNNPDPDTISPDDHPCNPDAEASVCCGTGWTCLSDGVCKIRQDGNDFYYRGTCTDFTWKSQSCPGFYNATTEPLIQCNTPGEDWYCCAGDDQCDCTTGKFAVQLNGPATTLTIFGAAASSTTASSSTSKAAASSSPTSKSGSSSSSSTGTSTANHSAAPAATSPSVNSTTTHNDTNSTAIGVGVGVGVGVSLLIIAALSSWYRRRSRRRRQGQVDANNEASQAGLGLMKQHFIHEGDGARSTKH